MAFFLCSRNLGALDAGSSFELLRDNHRSE